MRASTLAISLALALLPALAVAQTTIYVDQATGSDADSGLTPMDAVATVTRGAQLVSGGGGTLEIGPGVYAPSTGELYPASASGTLVVRGAGPGVTILDGEGLVALLSLAGLDLTLEGFTARNGMASVGAGITAGDPATLVLRDVEILDCAASIGGGIHVAQGSRGAHTTFERCRLQGNTASIGAGIQYQINTDEDATLVILDSVLAENIASIGGAVQFQENGIGQHTLIVERSRFTANAGAGAGGIHFQRNAGTAIGSMVSSVFADNDAALVANDTAIAVINCTFTGNGNAFTCGSGGMAEIAGSIFWGNGTELSGGAGSIRFSIVEGLALGGFADGGNNLDLDPLLDATHHLLPGSPAIDQGDAAAAATHLVTLDLDGEMRVQDDTMVPDGPGGAIDIGADEVPAGPPPPVCGGFCGDCNSSGALPDILDALTAAQVAAGLIVPTMLQTICCDIDASMVVNILDALGIAQSAAGLSVVLMCP